jgi:integrase
VALKSDAARRDVVLMRALASELRRARIASRFCSNADFVFTTRNGRPVGQRYLAHVLTSACADAKLDGVSFHVLRHSYASILIGQRRDPRYVAAALGHSNPGFTMRTYAHLFDRKRHADQTRDALDADFGDAFAAPRLTPA